LVVTREGFPLAHFTLAGNKQDLQTVQGIVEAIEKRFGRSQRVWVMDRGMISKESLRFLSKGGRRYLLATRRSDLKKFQDQLGNGGWQSMPNHPDVRVKSFQRRQVYYLLARSKPRRQKERAMRRKQRHGLAKAVRQLHKRIAAGRLKNRDKILEAVGRIKARYPKARSFVNLTVTRGKKPELQWSWKIDLFKAALARDGAYLLRSNRGGWSATEFWETYIQLTVVERAFRVLKSELLLRPVWHQYPDRVEAHVLICVLAYALWKTLDHLAKQANLQTVVKKADPDAEGNTPRPLTPEAILRELANIKLGDILLESTDGKQLVLTRVARPNAEQARILEALKLTLPERLSPDRLL
jgi:transposase